jgi:hypothetical protein
MPPGRRIGSLIDSRVDGRLIDRRPDHRLMCERLLEAEGRVFVAHEVHVGVDPLPPAKNADVKVEQAVGKSSSKEDREQGDDPDDAGSDEQREEHDVVRKGKNPFDGFRDCSIPLE